MKRLLLSCFLCIAASCATDNKHSFTLEGTITNAQESEEVYLSYPVFIDGLWYDRTDTAKITNGRFRFEGGIPETVPAVLFFDDMTEASLYLEPAKLRLRMDRLRPYAYELSGLSVEHENTAYRNALGDHLKQADETQRRAHEQNMRWLEADERDKDSLWTLFYETAQAYRPIAAAMDSLRLNFISEHMDYAITPHLLYLCSKMQRISGRTLIGLYERLPEKSRNSVMGQLAEIQTGLHSGATGWDVGDTAPDFCRIDAAGNRIRLSDYRDKSFVLLDFWASWCGPCLRELPKVKELHAQYGPRGLQLIGISSDDDRDRWLEAVAAHGLTVYPQILAAEPDSEGRRPFFAEQADISVQYEIMSIPFCVLIDKEGRIVARWQHTEQEQLARIGEIMK